MGKYNSIEIGNLDNNWEYTRDQIEIDGLNDFFRCNFESYFVKVDVDNKYVGAVGMNEKGNTFLVLGSA